jgi:NitT/TauT family transport system permease protein
MTVRRVPWRLVSLAAVFGAWEIAGRTAGLVALPPASEVFAALAGLARDGSLALAFGETIRTVVVGTVLALIVGMTLGLAMGLSGIAERLFVALLICLDTAPMAALVPLITSIYGIGFAAKIAAVMLLSVPVIALNAYRGVRSVSPVLLAMHRSFMGNRWQAIRNVILPGAGAMLAAGIHLGVAGAFVGALLAELLINTSGIGELIVHSRAIGRFPDMYGAIVAFMAFTAGTLAVLRSLERRAMPSERWSGAAG